MTDTDTQAPDVTQDDTQPTNDTAQATDTFDREYVQSLRQENAKWRTKARELQEAAEARTKELERQKLSELERLEADLKERDAKLQEYEANLRREKAIRKLSSHVIDPEAAFKLADGNPDLLTEDGDIDPDRLLQTFTFLAPQATPARAPVTPANSTAAKQGQLSPDDFRGKPADWVRENLHRLKRS